jgi:hypothetical protein
MKCSRAKGLSNVRSLVEYVFSGDADLPVHGEDVLVGVSGGTVCEAARM